MKHNQALRRHANHAGTRGGVVISALHPAFHGARSIFANRIFDPHEVRRLLKDGHQSRKIGKVVAKGARRGWPIFTLTLEERATCPRECKAWALCYGNNMQWAERIVAGPALEAALWLELEQLQRRHRRGFMVRLHILGDFYSPEYVALWARALKTFPALHVFGFTAHRPDSDIGLPILRLTRREWARFSIRFSGMPGSVGASQIVPDHDPGAILCPAQTGATECCATCALCWHSRRSIAFERH